MDRTRNRTRRITMNSVRTNTNSEESVTVHVKTVRKRKGVGLAKRLTKSAANFPSRKSKRLLFRKTKDDLAKFNVEKDDSTSSVSPYGRLVEMIDTEQDMNRGNVMTKILFLGSLDLAYKDLGGPGVVSSDEVCEKRLKHLSVRSRSRLSPSRIFVVNPPSLKNLCVLSLIKPLKEKLAQGDEEYLNRTPKLKEEDQWDSFEEHISILLDIAESQKPLFPPPNLPNAGSFENCLRKLARCGTKVEINEAARDPLTRTNGCIDQNDSIENERQQSISEDPPHHQWLNWGEYMTKSVQFPSTSCSNAPADRLQPVTVV